MQVRVHIISTILHVSGIRLVCAMSQHCCQFYIGGNMQLNPLRPLLIRYINRYCCAGSRYVIPILKIVMCIAMVRYVSYNNN